MAVPPPASPGTCGRGPTSDISPLRTLSSCGISSMLVLRKSFRFDADARISLNRLRYAAHVARIRSHGAELVDLEAAIAIAVPVLKEQDRTWRRRLDPCRNRDQDGAKHRSAPLAAAISKTRFASDDAGFVRLLRRERWLVLYTLFVLLPANSRGRTDIGARSLKSGLTLSRLKLAVTMEAIVSLCWNRTDVVDWDTRSAPPPESLFCESRSPHLHVSANRSLVVKSFQNLERNLASKRNSRAERRGSIFARFVRRDILVCSEALSC